MGHTLIKEEMCGSSVTDALSLAPPICSVRLTSGGSVDACVPGRLRRGMCERHYRRWLKRDGDVSDPQPIDHLTRYEVQPSGCWHWTGPLYPNGYGHASTHGLVHRYYYTHLVGAIPRGLDLDHTCHNSDLDCPGGWACVHRRCVNPDHLEPATRSVNLKRNWKRRKDGRRH